MAKGFPVVISEFGTPVIPVGEGAPVASVAANGMGTPITIVDSGAPQATPMVLVWDNIITSIFADGTDGFYFDFSKTDQLFQTVNGGAAADDPGENIALALESHAWAGRTLAEELAAQTQIVTNGTFADGTTSWASGSSFTSTAAVVTGEMQVTPTVDFGRQIQSLSLTVGKTYLLSGTLRRVSGGTTNGAYVSIGVNSQSDSIVVATSSSTVAVPFSFYFVPTNSNININLAARTGNVGGFDDISVKEIPGNHARQATTAAQPKWQTGGTARFDGSDDCLLTPLMPSASLTYMVKLKVGSILGRLFMGSATSTTGRAHMGTNQTTGALAAGVGNQNTTVITGGADISGQTGVATLVVTPSEVNLLWNAVSVYKAAADGGPNTSIAILIGGQNNNGTPSFFLDGDIYYALAIKKALTAAQIAAITNLWGTS